MEYWRSKNGRKQDSPDAAATIPAANPKRRFRRLTGTKGASGESSARALSISPGNNQRGCFNARAYKLRALPFVFTERRQFHFGLARIRPRHGLAVVAQIFLREPFGITGGLRPFRPRITVAVQRHAFDFEADAALANSVARSPARTLRRYGNNGPFPGKFSQDFCHVFIKACMMAIEPVFLRA